MIEYSDEQLNRLGYKKLGRLLGSGRYTGEDWKKISYYYDKAKDANRY